MDAEDNGIDDTGQEDQSTDSDNPADDMPEAANISQASEMVELVNSFLEELLPEENAPLSSEQPEDNPTALEEPVTGEDAAQFGGEPGTAGPDLDGTFPEVIFPDFIIELISYSALQQFNFIVNRFSKRGLHLELSN